MSTDSLNLGGIRNLNEALKRTPNGVEMVLLATKLGLWTPGGHNPEEERPVFKKNLADLTPQQISNEMGTWTAEFGRVTELIGILNGQKDYLRTRLKSAVALARSAARKAAEKTPTASAVNDAAEESPEVLTINETLSLVELIFTQAAAVKEVTAQYIASISREISYRDAQLKAKIYGG